MHKENNLTVAKYAQILYETYILDRILRVVDVFLIRAKCKEFVSYT